MVCEEDKQLLRKKVWLISEEFRQDMFDEITLCFDYGEFQRLWHQLEHLELPADCCYFPYFWQELKFLKRKQQHPNS